MGAPFIPLYGKDLGSAIENAEKIIAKIKTNRFDKDDLKALDKVIADIKEAVADENED